ncbi:HAMP domain-containing protein [Duganella sp. FT50W]|uniref:HAMP domain-containing protein n=1 Tax=Duganella lactea TaxID=2692173 RepID=A0A6L8MNM5_9BURK|nr:methyl-accepting chemotaxis protein [Duganella lactea]MYM82225.1 HAMP domain-containing protein [Duganella lactea]
MNISNLKIGTRLGAGFAVVLVLMALIAVTAISRINRINDATANIMEDRYVKVRLTKEIYDEVNVQARLLRNAVIGAKDPAEVTSSLGRMEDSVQKNRERLDKFKSLISTSKGQEVFAKLMEARAAYAAARDKAAQMLRDGRAEAAGSFVLKELRPPQNAFLAALADMIKFQESLMQESGAQAASDGKTAILFTLVLSMVALIASVVIGWLLTRSITRPVNQALQLAQTVAAGDLTAQVPTAAKDEIGQLLTALAAMNDSLKQIVGEVRTGTNEIATATTEVANGNMDLSARTEQQASALEETASSMEELTSTVRQNGDNARQANQLAQSAAEVALKGGDVVSQVVVTMDSINTSASKIVDIISVIDGIAFQTNILALNAAVEAARAGEQGRGFAVVASEVRNLAQRSASAAKEIKELISDSVNKVEAGNELVGSAGTTMGEVVDSVQRLASLIGEITAASREQEVGIEQINEAVTSMDTVTQQNAALVEEAAAATGALQDQAARLAQVVSVFKLDNVSAPAPRPVSKPAARPVPAAKAKPAATTPRLAQDSGRPAATPARASVKPKDEMEWEEF